MPGMMGGVNPLMAMRMAALQQEAAAQRAAADLVAREQAVAAAAAAAAAVADRRRTGRGRHIDASMYEACVGQMAGALVQAQIDGAPQRNGNRDAAVRHQGVYPPAGEDRWIAISAPDARSFDALKALAGGGDWSSDPDAVDERLAAWTAGFDRYDLMARLQAAGVPAGVVQDSSDIVERDPQLRGRGFLEPIDNPVLGVFGHQAPPFKLSRTPARLSTAPGLGQHTEDVVRFRSGVAAERFLGTARESVIETERGPVWALLSIGAVVTPIHAIDPAMAIARAEEALTQARKQPAGDVVIYEPSEQRRSERSGNARHAAEIVQCLKESRFQLAFQPVVDGNTGEPVFHEALLRMTSDDGRIVPAGHLIPVAETLGDHFQQMLDDGVQRDEHASHHHSTACAPSHFLGRCASSR